MKIILAKITGIGKLPIIIKLQMYRFRESVAGLPATLEYRTRESSSLSHML